LYRGRHCDVSARFTAMKRLIMLVPFVSLAALLAGCPDEEKKDAPPAASASASAVPTQTVAPATASVTASATAPATASAAPVVDAAAPADAGKVADAGKAAAPAPKK
jgi:hypothetical protein